VIAPDLAGFRAAQNRLIQQVGITAVFVHEGQSTYASDVPMNPNTGKPYDPFATPTSSTAERRETVQCGIVARVAVEGDTRQTAIGMMSRESVALLCNIVDLPRITGADRVEFENEVYELRSIDQDSIGARAIAFVEHA
jgi:hypothetical protein